MILLKSAWKYLIVALGVMLSVLFVFIGCSVTYWTFYPSVPLIVYSAEFKVTNPDKAVCAGSYMKYEVDFEKTNDAQCRITRQIYNGYGITYEVGEPPFKGIGRKTENYSIYVPPSTEEAMWYMRWTADCEGRNKIDNPKPVSRLSERFRVVDCNPKPSQGK
jgi:hypothetical protein